jgi:hypothetical protein
MSDNFTALMVTIAIIALIFAWVPFLTPHPSPMHTLPGTAAGSKGGRQKSRKCRELSLAIFATYWPAP